MRRWSWLWCAGAFALAQAPACHAFRICAHDDCEGIGSRAGEANVGGVGEATHGAGGPGSAELGGGGALSEAGAAAEPAPGGDAGSAGESSSHCTAPRADCDDSSLNGCEVDLSLDVDNCGRCGVRCGGVCVTGACHAFEPLIASVEAPDFAGITFTSSEIYCLSRSAGFAETDLLSVSKNATGVSTLLSGTMEVDRLLPGVDRLYLFSSDGDARLWSVPFAGGALYDEQLGAQAAALSGTWLYVIDDEGKAVRRSELHREVVEPLQLPSSVSASATMTLSATANLVALVASDSATRQYSMFTLDPANPSVQWRLVATDVGVPRHVRLGQDAIYLAVTKAQGVEELREYRFDGTPRLLTSVAQLIDFAVYAGQLVYVSWQDRDQRGLRVLSLDDPQHARLDFQSSDTLRSLEIDGQYLYFGAALRRNLARLPLWLDAAH